MTAPSPIAIFILVYNGETILPSCLSSLLQQKGLEHISVDIWVGVNGSTDKSAEVARNYALEFEEKTHWHFHVYESSPGGRVFTLNALERLCNKNAIRFYLDQDVILSKDALIQCYRTLIENDDIHFTSGNYQPLPSKSFFSKAYGQIWPKLPYVKKDVATCGFFALSAQGRNSWQDLPKVASDDKYVRLQFKPEERRLLESIYYQTALPEGLYELVKARQRYDLANQQLKTDYPSLENNAQPKQKGMIKFVITHPNQWLNMISFVIIAIATRVSR